MRKKTSEIWRLWLAIAVCILLIGCGVGEENTKPKGVIEQNNREYYLIRLPEDSSVEDYFTLTGQKGRIICSFADINGTEGSKELGIVAYSQIQEGGWIGWQKNRIIYLPADSSENEIQKAGMYVTGLRNDYMTIEEAAVYLPWIAECSAISSGN